MASLWIDLLSAAAVAGGGGLAGYWMGNRRRLATIAEPADDAQRVRDALARLHSLAQNMATEVDQHNERLEAISQDLRDNQSPDPEDVVQAVVRLVEANQTTRGRLASAEEKLQEQAKEIEVRVAEARTDALTMLPNRRAFDDEITRRISESQRYGKALCVLIFDIDHFKKFNDTYGHLAGDEVLRGIGRVLRRTMRQMDMVTRFGGEEFAAIFPGSELEEAKRGALRAREAIEKAVIAFEDQSLKVTASLGLAQWMPGETAEALIKRADEALYLSKKNGRNQVSLHDGQTVQPVANAPSGKSPSVARPEEKPARPAEPAAASPVLPVQPAIAPKRPAKPVFAPRPVMMVQLSQLADRTTFCQLARQRLAEWKRGGDGLSVLLVEIDYFEQIANRFGQAAAEKALATVARLVQGAIREMDYVARYAPDCFAILLPRAGVAPAIRIAERLRHAVTQEAPIDEEDFRFTVSIGVAEALNRDDMISLMQRAEAAVDAGMQHGGNSTYQHDGQRCAPISALLEAVNYLAEPMAAAATR